jgi:hypothetical protein
VIAANRVPDHSMIAEFRQRHEAALADLFSEVLELCREAGLVRVGVIAVDGTKVHANASSMADRNYRQAAEEILADAARIDQEEDELYGDKRGDWLPGEVSTHNGRREWLREARRRLDEQRGREGKPAPRPRPARLREAKNRLQEELWTEQRANQAYEQWRARGISADGARRMAPGKVKPYTPPCEPQGKVNITDPDSRNLKAFRGYVQGCNAQAVVTEDQVVIAAEIKTTRPTSASSDRSSRSRAGSSRTSASMKLLRSCSLTPVAGTTSRWTRSRPRALLSLSRLTRPSARPPARGGAAVGQIKFNRRIDRFLRRGRAAALSEWRLATATHNLLKLHQHRIATTGP